MSVKQAQRTTQSEVRTAYRPTRKKSSLVKTGIAILSVIFFYGLCHYIGSLDTESDNNSQYVDLSSDKLSDLRHALDSTLGTQDSSIPYLGKSRTKKAPQEISDLAAKIDEAKVQLSILEAELSQHENSLKAYKNYLENLLDDIENAERQNEIGLDVNRDIYQQNIYDYNNYLEKHNNLYAVYSKKFKKYRKLWDATKTNIDRYNNQIGTN